MTETADVSPRARATLPRGFADRDAHDLAAAEAMMAKIGEVYALYGFEAVETPFVEYTDALGKFLPDQDRPNEGVFSFKDDDEQWLSLRYDLTAPLARYVAENYDRLPKPYRSYRAGWVFRNEKPGPGRFRQFMQFDADTVGSASPAADAEICMMAADCLEALGIARGDYLIKVNNRKVLDGLMESIGLGGPETPGAGSPCFARSTSSTDSVSTAWPICWVAGARTKAAISPRARGSTPTKAGKYSMEFDPALPVPSAALARRRGMKGLGSFLTLRNWSALRAMIPIAFASTPLSCAGSNITPARSSRRN